MKTKILINASKIKAFNMLSSRTLIIEANDTRIIYVNSSFF